MDAQNFNTAVEDLIAKVVGGKAQAVPQVPARHHATLSLNFPVA
jgi:hypothetical protein